MLSKKLYPRNAGKPTIDLNELKLCELFLANSLDNYFEPKMIIFFSPYCRGYDNSVVSVGGTTA